MGEAGAKKVVATTIQPPSDAQQRQARLGVYAFISHDCLLVSTFALAPPLDNSESSP